MTRSTGHLRSEGGVELRNAQRRFKLDVRRIKRAVQALLKGVGRSEAQVSVLFVDDQKMRQLHRQWMGEDAPTDVLSFPMEERVLGDVVISVETAARRAPKNVTRETVRYLIHGLLHLIGHDHVGRTDRRRMSRESRRLMKLIQT